MQPSGNTGEKERFVTYAPVSDKELEKARKAVLAAIPVAAPYVRAATRSLRMCRAQLARIAGMAHEDEEVNPDTMTRTFAAITAFGVVGHVENGTPLDHAEATDEESYHAMLGTAGGWAMDATTRELRAVFVACYLLNAPQLASRLAEMKLAGTLPMLERALGGSSR